MSVAESKGSKGTSRRRKSKEEVNDAAALLASLRLEMPVSRDISAAVSKDSMSWVTHIQNLEDQVHKLTEQIWESKKKNVKQMMMKIGWGSAAMRMSVFVAWKENITKVKVERIIEEDARTRHRYETEINMLKYRVEELEREKARMASEQKEVEERVIKEGTLRRKLEAKSQVWDAQVDALQRQLRAAKRVVEAVQGLGTTTLITNFQNEHQAADLELEAILKEAKRKGQLAPGDVHPGLGGAVAQDLGPPRRGSAGPPGMPPATVCPPAGGPPVPPRLPGPGQPTDNVDSGVPGLGFGALGQMSRGMV